MEFLTEYGLFLAKAITIVVAVGAVIALIVGSAARHHGDEDRGQLKITKLNERFEKMRLALSEEVLPAAEFKKLQKQLKEQHKAREKQAAHAEAKARLYVLDFKGDIRAQAVKHLRDEITAVLSVADKRDEVMVRLESAGGLVHSYGLAASQLDRIRQAGIPLTACIDKVAASGGYMMACVADKVIAAPFAVLGSIGVVAQIPNFNRLLKKHEIDVELHTAGEHKRTLTMFGVNTEKDREKFREDLEDTHQLFKDFVAEHRPQVKIDEVATGDVWFGRRAKDKLLVDELLTSDDYLVNNARDKEVYLVHYEEKKNLMAKLGLGAEQSLSRIVNRVVDRFTTGGHF